MRMRVHPNSELGVKMSDGTVYKPDRSGMFEASDAHAREISTSYNAKTLGLFSNPVGTFADSVDSGLPCPQCSFVGWSWQESCPKGHQLTKGD